MAVLVGSLVLSRRLHLAWRWQSRLRHAAKTLPFRPAPGGLLLDCGLWDYVVQYNIEKKRGAP